jgi:chorismate synthase
MSSNPTPGQRPTHTADGMTIRSVATPDEYDECVAIQHETWGRDFTESVPATILRIAQEVGGVTAAAFDADGAMLGFVFGITGIRDGQLSHWSDMLAIRAGSRDRGIGKKLKAYQRDLLLPLGVRVMYWTYDPLVARNAHLNIQQLGARVVEYRSNYYGADTGSVMHTGLGTDRFIVSWDLDNERTPEVPDAEWMHVPVANSSMSITATDSHRVRIAIPEDILAVLGADPVLAGRWRESTHEAFTTFMARGYSVVGFLRGAGPAPSTYLLER